MLRLLVEWLVSCIAAQFVKNSVFWGCKVGTGYLKISLEIKEQLDQMVLEYLEIDIVRRKELPTR